MSLKTHHRSSKLENTQGQLTVLKGRWECLLPGLGLASPSLSRKYPEWENRALSIHKLVIMMNTMSNSLLRQKSSNSLPLVSVTSEVFFLPSLGGNFNWLFQPLTSWGWCKYCLILEARYWRIRKLESWSVIGDCREVKHLSLTHGASPWHPPSSHGGCHSEGSGKFTLTLIFHSSSSGRRLPSRLKTRWLRLKRLHLNDKIR